MKKPTLHDVARRAGVSIATVSHAVNGSRFVREETRHKVEKAIRELGYQQNIFARQLRTGTNNIIGFVIPDITNIFYATFVQRVSDYCMMKGYSLVLVNTFETPLQEKEHLKALASHQLGGLIMASTVENYDEIQHLMPQVPTLLFDRRLEGCPYEIITIDSYQAYFDATIDMVRKGHRKIGYLAGIPRLSTSKDRYRGFSDALNSVDFPCECRLVAQCDSLMEKTISETNRLVAQGCTAIIASNRSMLLAAICALASQNLRIGEDIQLVGSTENTPILPFTNKINLISQPIHLVSDCLAASIIRKIESPELPLDIPTFCSTYEPL